MEKSIKKIEKWLNKKGFSICFRGDTFDFYDDYNKTIYISTRQKKETQLFGLLHECGHLLIQTNPTYKKNFPITNKVYKNKKFLHTNLLKMENLEEEIEAWRRGKKLAERLNIKLNEESFEKTRIECLRSYFF